MGRPLRDAGQAIMREYYCADCHAPPGQACMTKSGGRASAVHASRWQQAVAAGRLPVEVSSG